MKKLIAIALFVVALGASRAGAQDSSTNNPPPPPPPPPTMDTNSWWTNSPPPALTNAPTDLPPSTNLPPVWTNTPPVFTNLPPVDTNTPPTWTNTPPVFTNTPPVFTNLPPVWTNLPPVATNLPPICTNAPTGLVPTNSLPKNVQGVADQFNKQRAQLISQLQSSDPAQRTAALQQLVQLRQDWQTQVQGIMENAKNQAINMPGKFANPPPGKGGLNGNSGGGSSGGGGSTSPGMSHH